MSAAAIPTTNLSTATILSHETSPPRITRFPTFNRELHDYTTGKIASINIDEHEYIALNGCKVLSWGFPSGDIGSRIADVYGTVVSVKNIHDSLSQIEITAHCPSRTQKYFVDLSRIYLRWSGVVGQLLTKLK